jgi:ATP-dependent DNA helicase RecG
MAARSSTRCEAILNAVSHRDYRHPGSVFLRQFPRRIEIVSPGGFPPGITPANILDEQNPRNRRLAEALARCGLVERAGQGLDLMVSRSVQQGKRAPDFSRTVPHEVRLTLDGRITDPKFLAFLERVGRRTLSSFSAHDLLVLDHLHREERVPPGLRPRLPRLIRLGVVESVGRGRGTRFFLSRQMHTALGRSGAYTRQRGLDRAQNKALLLKHIEESAEEGAKFGDLQQVLPGLSRSQVQALLRELRDEGRIVSRGVTKAARWSAAPEKQSNAIQSNPTEQE